MAKEKFSVATAHSDFPFIPPLSQAWGWLRLPPPATLLNAASKEVVESSPDGKTLRRFFGEGVTSRSATKIEGLLTQLCNRYNLSIDEMWGAEKKVVRLTNGYQWLSCVPRVLDELSAYQPTTLTMPRTVGFLETRSHAEDELVLTAFEANAFDASRHESRHFLKKRTRSILDRQTQLEPGECEALAQALCMDSTPTQASSPFAGVTLARAFLGLRIDFYHQLFSALMADLLEKEGASRLPRPLCRALDKGNGMSELMPKFDGKSVITPTRRVYELWREVFAPAGIDRLSLQAMATHIPEPKPERTRTERNQTEEERENTHQQTRRKRLKEWYAGTVPETSQLTAFLESLCGRDFDAFIPFVMTRAATAWTHWGFDPDFTDASKKPDHSRIRVEYRA